MISERLKNLLRVLIFAFLASGIALVLLLQIQNYHRMQIYLATEAAMPRHKPNGEIRVYKNETAGYSFMYPSKLSISTSAGAVELYHQIPYKNSGECNMKGDEAVYDYLADFRVNIFITSGTIAQVVKKMSPYMPEENFIGQTLKINPGFIDSFVVGGLKGFSIYEGVEGCGHIIYYFPLADAKVLVVKRNLVEKLSSVVTPEVNQDVLVTPGVINPGQADVIFKQLLKSFQYHPQVSNSRELDSETWKTYKNEQYGFEVGYPKDWLLINKKEVGSSNTYINLISSQDAKMSLFVSIQDPKKEFITIAGLGKLEKVNFNNQTYEASVFPNGWECYKNMGPDCSLFIVVHKNLKGNFEVSGQGGIGNGKIPEIYLQILSTFKFTDSADTISLEIYKNKKYGFEFKYPQEWSYPALKDEVVELGCPKEDFEGELKCPLTFSILAPIQKTEFIKTLNLTPFKYGEKLVNWNGPEIENLNFRTFDAITYRSVGMCNYTNSVYFGQKINIHFQDNCEKYFINGQYKQIANTFKFTK